MYPDILLGRPISAGGLGDSDVPYGSKANPPVGTRQQSSETLKDLVL